MKTRNNAEHIAVSAEEVVEYNKIAAAVTYDWALEIKNDVPASDGDIIEAIQSINPVKSE